MRRHIVVATHANDVEAMVYSIVCAGLVLVLGAAGGPAVRAPSWPAAEWPSAAPQEMGLDPAMLEQAKAYALSGGGSGCVVRLGRRVIAWGDQRKLYDLKSTTKSIGVTALGLAIADGKVRLEDKAVQHHPGFGCPPDENRHTGWLSRVTLLHLATHTAGFAKPGGYTALGFEPGTRWAYSDGGPNWLADCLTLVYRRDLAEVMFERVFAPLGIRRSDLGWRENAYRPRTIEGIPRREFGSGIHANVDAMARIGYLYLRMGEWKGERILPRDFVAAVGRPPEWLPHVPVADPRQYGQASRHYGLLWWNNADGTLKGVPRDAFWSWGLYESLIVVIPSLDLVVARAGESWKRASAEHYDVLRGFLEPIVGAASAARPGPAVLPGRPPLPGRPAPPDQPAAPEGPGRASGLIPRQLRLVSASGVQAKPPYPPSPVIAGIQWAPPETVVRRAPGSDNWPLTWGDDDVLYGAYGDGRGFAPFVERKLSLGLCRIVGGPEDFRGENLRSPSAERTGDGPAGPKASGMLMVEGTLYMLVRNTGNAQLAWSRDRGRTWTWAQWKFRVSFGCPTFLNFGPNYAGARDAYVYLYSPDSPSAYRRADRMVLARVPKDRITDPAAYEYFQEIREGSPVWTRDVHRRGAVFVHAGHCYRSSVTWHPVLRRYLWCQTGLGDDPRWEGGLAIYDAPEPWGPWTTVFFTTRWDIGPGETSSLPSKWMSADGRTAYLVFSGNDCFSVRKATFLERLR